jgi:hypothetical protein
MRGFSVLSHWAMASGRSLLVGALDRILRRVAPELQIVPHGAHGERNAEPPRDQFDNGRARPQRERQRQLIRRRVGDRALDGLLLLRRQPTMRPNRRATLLRRDGVQTACLMPVPPHRHGHVVHAERRADLGERTPFLAQRHRHASLLRLGGWFQCARIGMRHTAR